MLKGLVKGYIYPIDYGTRKNPADEKKLKLLASNLNNNIQMIFNLGNYKIKNGCI